MRDIYDRALEGCHDMKTSTAPLDLTLSDIGSQIQCRAFWFVMPRKEKEMYASIARQYGVILSSVAAGAAIIAAAALPAP